MPRPLRVFLCYASQNKPVVRELYQRLKAENWIDPWLDKAKILPGQDWELVIEKAVDDSDVVIVCLSKQSVSKEGFVQREIRYAYDLALEKPEEMIFLIPLRLDDCNVPRKLKSLHWVDYFGMGKKSSYFDLLEALKLCYDQKLGLEEEQSREKSEKENSSEERVEKKFTQSKPFTRILNPSVLNPPKTRETRSPKPSYRWVGIAGSVLLILILGGFGLNSLLSKSSGEMAISTSQIPIETPPADIRDSITPTLEPTETTMPTPTLGIGSTMISEKDGMVMVYVPAGEFTMGSKDGEVNEQPVRQVSLGAYWIDQTEVTNVMYKRCVDDGGCSPPSSIRSYTRDNYYGNNEFDDYPVIYVNWNQANTYCQWVGRKLPTESEWEKAARGKDGRMFPWGNGLDCDKSNYTYFCFGDTSPVWNFIGGKSIYGVYDMAGNVWEWVSSLYMPYPYYDDDGREDLYASGSRVLRGGSWDFNENHARSTFRGQGEPTYSNMNTGFRCSLSP